MIIVYAAVAGQSVVKLYAAAMFPGFFLSFLYLVYIIGWAMINPKIAPPLPEEQTQVPVPDWMRKFQAAYSQQHVRRRSCRRWFRRRRRRRSRPTAGRVTYWMLLKNFCCRAGAVRRWSRGTLWLVVVVRRHSPAGGGRGRCRTGVAATGHAGLAAPAATPAEQGPPRSASIYWFWGIVAASAR